MNTYDKYPDEEYEKEYAEFSDLKGKLITDIIVESAEDSDGGSIIFRSEEGDFVLKHEQNCCEKVYLSEIVGDLTDFIGKQILDAEEATQKCDDNYTSNSWTFYKLRADYAYATIVFRGSSNGYYSEKAQLTKYTPIIKGS